MFILERDMKKVDKNCESSLSLHIQNDTRESIWRRKKQTRLSQVFSRRLSYSDKAKSTRRMSLADEFYKKSASDSVLDLKHSSDIFKQKTPNPLQHHKKDWSNNYYTLQIEDENGEIQPMVLSHRTVHTILKNLTLPYTMSVEEVVLKAERKYILEEYPISINYMSSKERALLRHLIYNMKQQLDVYMHSLNEQILNHFKTYSVERYQRYLVELLNIDKHLPQKYNIYGYKINALFEIFRNYLPETERNNYPNCTLARFYYSEEFKEKKVETQKLKRKNALRKKPKKKQVGESNISQNNSMDNKKIIQTYLHEEPKQIKRLFLLLRLNKLVNSEKNTNHQKIIFNSRLNEDSHEKFFDLSKMPPLQLTKDDLQYCHVLTVEQWQFLLTSHILIMNKDLFNYLVNEVPDVIEWMKANPKLIFKHNTREKGSHFEELQVCYQINDYIENVKKVDNYNAYSSSSVESFFSLLFTGFTENEKKEQLALWNLIIKPLIMKYKMSACDASGNNFLHYLLRQNSSYLDLAIFKEILSIFKEYNMPLLDKNKDKCIPFDYFMLNCIGLLASDNKELSYFEKSILDLYQQNIAELFCAMTTENLVSYTETILHLPARYCDFKTALLDEIMIRSALENKSSFIKKIMNIYRYQPKLLNDLFLLKMLSGKDKIYQNESISHELMAGNFEQAEALYMQYFDNLDHNQKNEIASHERFSSIDNVIKLMYLSRHNPLQVDELLYLFIQNQTTNSKRFFLDILMTKIKTVGFLKEKYQRTFLDMVIEHSKTMRDIENDDIVLLLDKYDVVETEEGVQFSVTASMNENEVSSIDIDFDVQYKELFTAFKEGIGKQKNIDDLRQYVVKLPIQFRHELTDEWINKMLSFYPSQNAFQLFLKEPAIEIVLMSQRDKESNIANLGRKLVEIIPIETVRDLLLEIFKEKIKQQKNIQALQEYVVRLPLQFRYLLRQEWQTQLQSFNPNKVEHEAFLSVPEMKMSLESDANKKHNMYLSNKALIKLVPLDSLKQLSMIFTSSDVEKMICDKIVPFILQQNTLDNILYLQNGLLKMGVELRIDKKDSIKNTLVNHFKKEVYIKFFESTGLDMLALEEMHHKYIQEMNEHLKRLKEQKKPLDQKKEELSVEQKELLNKITLRIDTIKRFQEDLKKIKSNVTLSETEKQKKRVDKEAEIEQINRDIVELKTKEQALQALIDENQQQLISKENEIKSYQTQKNTEKKEEMILFFKKHTTLIDDIKTKYYFNRESAVQEMKKHFDNLRQKVFYLEAEKGKLEIKQNGIISNEKTLEALHIRMKKNQEDIVKYKEEISNQAYITQEYIKTKEKEALVRVLMENDAIQLLVKAIKKEHVYYLPEVFSFFIEQIKQITGNTVMSVDVLFDVFALHHQDIAPFYRYTS